MESKPIANPVHLHIVLALLLSLSMITCGTTATIPEPRTQLSDGTHYAESEPDEQGWIATLEVQVESGRILGVTFDEVQRMDHELISRKSDDWEYGELWASATGGVNQFLVYSAIEQEFQRTAAPNISAISRATATVDGMQRLAERIIAGSGAQVALQDGWHRVELPPGEDGYHSALDVQVSAGRLIEVAYSGGYAQRPAYSGEYSGGVGHEDRPSAYSRIEARLRATADAEALAGISSAPQSVANARIMSQALFDR